MAPVESLVWGPSFVELAALIVLPCVPEGHPQTTTTPVLGAQRMQSWWLQGQIEMQPGGESYLSTAWWGAPTYEAGVHPTSRLYFKAACGSWAQFLSTAEEWETREWTDFVNTMKLRKIWAWGYIIPQHESSLFRVPWFWGLFQALCFLISVPSSPYALLIHRLSDFRNSSEWH